MAGRVIASKVAKTLSMLSATVLLAGCAGSTTGSPPQVSLDAIPLDLLETFEGCRLRGGAVSEGYPSTCLWGGKSYKRDEANGTAGDMRVILFDIAPQTASCDFGYGPVQSCLIVNGGLLYDPIKGYSHREGQGAVIAVRRTQICDPAEINSCPADAGIFRFEFVETYMTHR